MIEALTANDILLGLAIAIAVVILIILYHVLFIVVDLRKTMHRVEEVTQNLEDVILKPIAVADSLLEWVLQLVKDHDKKKK